MPRTETLIRVKTEVEIDECDDYTYSDVVSAVTVETEPVTFRRLLEERSHEAIAAGYIPIELTSGGKLNKTTVERLQKHGWVHLESVKSREDKKAMEQEYYILDPPAQRWSDPKFEKVDLDRLSDRQIERIAGTGRIAQFVAPKSVLPTDAYARLKTHRDRKAAEAAKRQEAKKKRAEKNRQKEIEAARKLLEEEGELKT